VNTVEAILRAKLKIALHYIASVRNESKLKVAVVLVAAVVLWLGALAGFLEGFDWLKGFAVNGSGEFLSIGDILMARLLAVFMVALLFLLTFSNVFVAYSTLYRSKEVAFLLQTPITLRAFFVSRFVECVLFSSWASAFLGSPLIIGYGLSAEASVVFYIAALAAFLPFIIIPAALGALVTLLAMRVLPKVPRGVLVVLGAAGVAAFFIFLRITFTAERLSDETLIPFLLDATRRTQLPFLPSTWVAQGILAAATQRYGPALYYFALLLSNAAMLVWLATECADKVFALGYSAAVGHERGRGIQGRYSILRHLDWLLRPLRNPIRALVIKDIRLFWRDPSQWTQFVVFFGIMAIYVANLGNRMTGDHSPGYRSWIACLNSGACSLVLATLTSRFVFPLVSLEGPRFWILGLAPLRLRQVVWQKFWLSVVTTVPFTVTLVVLSGLILKIEPIHFGLSLYTIVLANFGLAGLAVGLGSLYPNFEEDNPARIVSGMGGTLNFLFSIGYIAFIVTAQTLIMQWRVVDGYTHAHLFRWALVAVIALVGGASLMATFMPMRLGLRNLQNREF